MGHYNANKWETHLKHLIHASKPNYWVSELAKPEKLFLLCITLLLSWMLLCITQGFFGYSQIQNRQQKFTGKSQYTEKIICTFICIHSTFTEHFIENHLISFDQQGRVTWQYIYGASETLQYVLLFARLLVDMIVLHYLPVRGSKKHGVMNIKFRMWHVSINWRKERTFIKDRC